MTAAPSPVTWALILKKSPSAAKSRLAAVLDEGLRAQVAERLFQQVLAAALATAGIQRVAVISPEQPALPDQALWLADRANDMNACVRQGLHELAALGAQRVLVLPADLPLLHSGDLQEMLRVAAGCAMVIAPDAQQAGTNGLLLAVPTAIAPRFGLDSFSKHLAEAQHLGLAAQVVTRPGLAFDLDDQQDWQALCRDHPQQAAALVS